MPVWNSAMHQWEQAGDPFAMVRRVAPCCLLTPDEILEWERLTAWWLAWEPPARYISSVHGFVFDGRLNHSYYSARIREGATGLMQRAILDRLRRVAKLFGGPI